MDWITSPEAWVALATLTALEIVLGIDNIIFISILADRLPQERRALGRTLGLALAMVSRLALLGSLAWLSKLTVVVFTLGNHSFSARDLILLGGGLFLLGKATSEVHHNLEGSGKMEQPERVASFAGVLAQIMVLDIVFSLDSVITAIGMAQDLAVMMIAVIIAVLVMMLAAGPISRFVEGHPTVKMLALAFLLLVGLALIADGFHHHIPKGYIYFAMGFSIFVEMLNLKIRGSEPTERVTLRRRMAPASVDRFDG